MKQLLFVGIAMLVFQSFGLAQQSTYRKIDKHALAMPTDVAATVERLAAHLTAEADEDAERARAIYIWITNNITYSDTTVSNGWLGTLENARRQQAAEVLKNRTAVCEGFANLYKALCEAAGLRAEVVTGVVKEADGSIADVGHAWNAVEIDGEWYLTDPTWGSGYANYWRNRDQQQHQHWYFLVTGAEMIKTHLPDDPVWQLLTNPLAEKEFRQLTDPALEIRLAKPTIPFAYADTINLWFEQDSLTRKRVAGERILRYNPDNALALARLGNHFYNQTLTNFYRIEERMLSALDDVEQPLDTLSLLQKLAQAENDLERAWRYYHRVSDEKLQTTIAALPSARALRAEFIYLRGLMHVWQMMRLYKTIDYEQSHLAENAIGRMQLDATEAGQYFAKAEAVFHDYEGALYEEARMKVKLHKALVCHYLAKAMSFVPSLSEKSDEAALLAWMHRLDEAQMYYERTHAMAQEVLRVRAGSPLALSLVQDYPRSLAALQAVRGGVYLSLLGNRYAWQWENPTLITEEMVIQMTSDYQQCEDFYTTGMNYLDECRDMQGAREISTNLRTIKVEMHARLGDMQMYRLVNDLNSISAESDFRKRQPDFLKRFDIVLAHYQTALDMMVDNATLQKYMQETIQDIRSRRARVANR